MNQMNGQQDEKKLSITVMLKVAIWWLKFVWQQGGLGCQEVWGSAVKI